MTVMERSATERGPLFASPAQVFIAGWRHRALILRLARREIEARYRGSMLGVFWALVVPLLLLAVYTVVFSTIFPARWSFATGGHAHFALILFSGLILFNVFAEVVNRAPGLLFENITYVKKVVFPLEVLPWVSVTVALFNAAVSSAAFLAGYLLLVGAPPPTAAVFPLLLLPLVLLAVGASWFLSALGVYLRDIQQFVPVIVTVLLYLNPVFYPLDMARERLPAPLFALVQLSPIAVTVEGARNVLFAGAWPDWGALAVQVVVGWLVAWLGLSWFCKTRKGFADVV